MRSRLKHWDLLVPASEGIPALSWFTNELRNSGTSDTSFVECPAADENGRDDACEETEVQACLLSQAPRHEGATKRLNLMACKQMANSGGRQRLKASQKKSCEDKAFRLRLSSSV